MESLSLHILDIAENSIRAGATTIEIQIAEDERNDALAISVRDNGRGMDERTRRNALNPFFTTKTGKRFGLGLALLAQASRQAGGGVSMDSAPDCGTMVTATFKLSHPDMQPVGDIAETLAVLVAGYPEVRFVYDYRKGSETYHFDSGE